MTRSTTGSVAEGRAAAAALRRLRQTLGSIANTDPSREASAGPAGPDTPELAARYARRNTLIWAALAQARKAGLDAGIDFDEADERHPVVVLVELPTGQVSWHLPAHVLTWDGHSTEEKYARVAAFISTGR